MPQHTQTPQYDAQRLECTWCGDEISELRWTGLYTNLRDGNPTCEECCPDFSTGGCGDPVMDGPDFDDLPIAQKEPAND